MLWLPNTIIPIYTQDVLCTHWAFKYVLVPMLPPLISVTKHAFTTIYQEIRMHKQCVPDTLFFIHLVFELIGLLTSAQDMVHRTSNSVWQPKFWVTMHSGVLTWNQRLTTFNTNGSVTELNNQS